MLLSNCIGDRPRQVSAADAALEEYVAADHVAFSLVVEHRGPDNARREQHRTPRLQPDPVAFLQEAPAQPRGVRRMPQASCRPAPPGQVVVGTVQKLRLQVPALRHEGVAQDVVQVRVRVEQPHRL